MGPGPVTVGNTAPAFTVEEIAIGPDPATPGDDLTLVTVLAASDPDDVVVYNYRWQEAPFGGAWIDLAEHGGFEVEAVPDLPARATIEGSAYRLWVAPTERRSQGLPLISNEIEPAFE